MKMCTKIFARKCNIVNNINLNTFMKDNHLMGLGSGSDFALEINGEIVAGVQIKRKNPTNWDISRFCSKQQTTVIGGFSRLLHFFIKEYKTESITTFIDRRYGVGDYLADFGFKLKSCHHSFKWTDTKETFHRMRYPGNTGYDQGLYKIWDCGQACYIR